MIDACDSENISTISPPSLVSSRNLYLRFVRRGLCNLARHTGGTTPHFVHLRSLGRHVAATSVDDVRQVAVYGGGAVHVYGREACVGVGLQPLSDRLSVARSFLSEDLVGWGGNLTRCIEASVTGKGAECPMRVGRGGGREREELEIVTDTGGGG